jgi:DNA-binding MarR family transcriptional regulator
MAGREELISALREWTAVSMSSSMGTFLQFAKEHGVSMAQIGALFRISRRGACGVTDIGDELGVTSAAASQLLERLVQSGLVRRREDPDDRRAKRIVLTERGRGLLRAVMEARLRWFVAVADRLPVHERAPAAAALRRLAARASALATGPGDGRTSPRPNARERPDR